MSAQPPPQRPGESPLSRSSNQAPGRPGATSSQPAPFPGTEHVDPAEVFAGAGYRAPVIGNHPLAIAAVVLGALGVIPGLGIGAVVFGHLALRALQSPEERRGGQGMAIAGLVLGYVFTVLWLLGGLAALAL